MAGKSTISGTNMVSNTKKSSSQGLDVTFHSIATGKLRRYFSGKIWTSLKLDGELSNLSYHVATSSTGPFSRGLCLYCPLSLRSVSGVPVFIHESDLSMGLANKIAYKFGTKMYSTLSKLPVCLRSNMGAVTKAPGPKLQNQMNWWISEPTLIPKCQLYCLSVVLQVLVS